MGEIDDVEIFHVSTSTTEHATNTVMETGDFSDGAIAVENDCDKAVLRKPKSGRWWKSIRKERSSAIVKVKPLKSSWERKMRAKVELENVKKIQQEIRNKLAAKKAAKIEARKEHERRQKENERKAEIVQVIKNAQKLKKTKKKQLRRIEKRDTN
uniref:Coiled-coil domain-containing protein 86 n=1 Tax=Elaeophora elaphi TaxID=1147741 RepID=A0A0R3RWZ7_9BILA